MAFFRPDSAQKSYLYSSTFAFIIMMKYDFDEIIDRYHTDSIKYDGMQSRRGRSDLLPMWVADADFASCPMIIDRLRHRLEHPILGYTEESAGWRTAITQWLAHRFQWMVQPNELIFIPGIVRGIAYVLLHGCTAGTKVGMFSPVYMPFFQVPEAFGIEVIQSRLKLIDGRYEPDFERLEYDLRGCKYFILSNPHNPGGRVWTADELSRMADICHRLGVTVISDEIHADLTLPGHRHIPFATVSDTARRISISFLSPSKAFNIPGLASSYAVISNEELRRPFLQYMEGGEFAAGHSFAYIAVEAAYTPEGEQWLTDMLAYVQDNIDYTIAYLAEYIPEIRPMRPEASYLIFLDCRGLDLDADGINRLFEEQAGLALNDGRAFGPGGEGFMRLNVACPRSVLTRALNQLRQAVEHHRNTVF